MLHYSEAVRVNAMDGAAEPVSIDVDHERRVSGLLMAPKKPLACYVFAHGAGAGMRHPFMTAVATGLAERGIATLRYQFPYMEAGGKRPDTPKLAQATVRAAMEEAARLQPGLPLFAGGKSFGGRMTSQAQAAMALPKVQGLVFLGFPLHPAGKPSQDRAAHLSSIAIPMLFLQGTRDALAEIALLKDAVGALGPGATLALLDGADHSFHVSARSGRKDSALIAEALDAMADWIDRVVSQA